MTRWEYLERYVGTNWKAFAPVASRLQAGKVGLGWSWSALVLTPLRLIYRRRYIWALIALLFPVAGVLLPADLDVLDYICCVVVAAFGKSLYLRHALRTIDKIVAGNPDEAERLKLIAAAGGVNQGAVMLVIAVAVGASLLDLIYVQHHATPWRAEAPHSG